MAAPIIPSLDVAASDTESSGEASSVTLSPCTRKAIQDQSGDEVAIISLGAKDIKGKGQVEVWARTALIIL